MLDALQPTMKALAQKEFLRHSDMDVKVAVASCISEITRITAPEAPYDDDIMKVCCNVFGFNTHQIMFQSIKSYIFYAFGECLLDEH